MRKTIYNSGQSVNGVVFIREADRLSQRRGIFRCDCGREFTASFGNIKSGHTTSCGCKKSKNVITHGDTIGGKPSTEYLCWVGIRRRCFDVNVKHYKYYGGRGIKMDESWVNSFDRFLEDVGRKPAKNMSMDRIDNNEGYFKWNCRWVNMHTQSRNKRNNSFITHNGMTLCISDWAKELNISEQTIRTRINTRGWNPILAITTPSKKSGFTHYATILKATQK